MQTVALFFEKGKKTKDIFYYQLNLDRNIGKTNPLNKKDLEEFDELFQSRKDSDNSWKVSIHDVDKETWDLSQPTRMLRIPVKNVNPLKYLPR